MVCRRYGPRSPPAAYGHIVSKWIRPVTRLHGPSPDEIATEDREPLTGAAVRPTVQATAHVATVRLRPTVGLILWVYVVCRSKCSSVGDMCA